MKLPDEETASAEGQERSKEHDFGYWPDIAGVAAALAIVWMMFRFSDGVY